MKVAGLICGILSLFILSGCDNSNAKPEGKDVVDVGQDSPKDQLLLPFAVFFNEDGSAEPQGIYGKSDKVFVRDIDENAFPIQGKIRRVETITLVTYEASCDVLVRTSKGYKIIVIQDDNICKSIFP